MESIEQISDKLKLLGDKTRLTMLILLREKEWCVCDFVEVLDMSQPGISQHLRKLKSQGIVSETRRGQWVYYSLDVEDKPYIKAVLDQMPDQETVLLSLGKKGVGSQC
ncbi:MULTISPECIES: ArsR/SmtB family transcription factor [Paenibacillus]|uniref:Winged helix-turn-helix transcriptional regulator n=2 Tax=Paenibacillus TaxID=44249 RepID=A0A7Y6BW79_9BACL|nr:MULTISPECIES: metalloregulator ArsR/SmtB family transcription factor [Paenibacillus]KGP77518.1 ArsR family transcriptional regulator [Paenibacillus sp. MAEPY2]KGP79279.1 ArsR family transcriptional regulator [Paenibacillus sp. MAEPY1]MDN4605378.1 metalloregulator ArsR/SmtB family transcription factor [Paenibacillus vandeheii]NUU75260.1 winged helix-turn-helix transcriptional regulator [Paenibacillus xylanilyticus]